METTYRLNTRELTPRFLNALRETYPDQHIEIVVREQNQYELDATEYLGKSENNRKQLDAAIENIWHGENLITFGSLEEAAEAALQHDAAVL